MAEAVGAKLYEFEHRGNVIARYCRLSWRTIQLIRTQKPEVVFFQNPSIVLALLVATLKALRLTRAKTVGDFHNAGVSPPHGKFLVPFIIRHTNIVIVSNTNLSGEITRRGGNAVPIPDPIPSLHVIRDSAPLAQNFEVLFICSWAADEPIVEVLRAAQLLASNQAIRIAITGRPRLQKIEWTDVVPDNVELTDFLSDAQFEQRLVNASLILDLTTRSDCMVCGAYEAVAASVPMILSGNEPTKAYFTRGALFTNNSANDIANKIQHAYENHAELARQVNSLQKNLKDKDASAIRELADAINAL